MRVRFPLPAPAVHPSGIDLGPCFGDRLAEGIKTASGRIECAPEEFLEAASRLQLPDAGPDNRLFLISRRHIRSNNSWLGNSGRLLKGPERCTMEINPVDAADRQLADGGRAVVANGTRSIAVTVAVTEDMMPGCISIPHGWGHELPGVALAVARDHSGVSINDVTDDSRLDPLSGHAALAGVRVSVEAAGPTRQDAG